MQARVARLYEGGENDAGCPGEQECETWKASADDQPPEARCPSCPKWQGGKDKEQSDELDTSPESWEERQLLDRVERLARERDSGRRVYHLLVPLEWELLIIRDEAFEVFKRSHEMRVASMFEMLISMTAR